MRCPRSGGRMPGKYFDQFATGETIRHDVRRTVTETDNLLFTALTHNTQPMHLDAEAAAKSEFGHILVNSIFTFGFMLGVSVTDTTQGTLVANLGMDKVVFPKPVRIGDTLHAETQVVDIRKSKSRPGQGIVVFQHHCFNQRNEIVAQCLRTALLKRSDA
ncbi:MaoC family dehydratase [Streptomyces sp. AcH 505]|uniref:MaoC family dehydratase n=1 Tax=Streptomyces sp. AcH 505 TaxID=352211 RepID=UPI00325A5461